MDDLVRQLRRDAAEFDSEIYADAADEIERLREALREIYEVYAGSEGIPQPMTAAEGYLLSLFMEAVRIAQEARRRKTDGYRHTCFEHMEKK